MSQFPQDSMRLRGEKFLSTAPLPPETRKLSYICKFDSQYKVKDCKLGGRYWLVGISDTYGVQILKNDGKQQKVFANEWSSLITCQK